MAININNSIVMDHFLWWYSGQLSQSSAVDISYSAIGSDICDSENANCENVLFEDPQFAEGYTLQYTSPCIDSGDPESPLDPDGTIADMGAYYFDQSIAIGDLNDDGSININDIIILVQIVLDAAEGNYPDEEEFLYGDIYSDGQINVIDIVALVNIVLEQ